jgi:hypothetical protein
MSTSIPSRLTVQNAIKAFDNAVACGDRELAAHARKDLQVLRRQLEPHATKPDARKAAPSATEAPRLDRARAEEISAATKAATAAYEQAIAKGSPSEIGARCVDLEVLKNRLTQSKGDIAAHAAVKRALSKPQLLSH